MKCLDSLFFFIKNLSTLKLNDLVLLEREALWCVFFAQFRKNTLQTKWKLNKYIGDWPFRRSSQLSYRAAHNSIFIIGKSRMSRRFFVCCIRFSLNNKFVLFVCAVNFTRSCEYALLTGGGSLDAEYSLAAYSTFFTTMESASFSILLFIRWSTQMQFIL